MPLFTVVVPTYNRPGLLADALGSVCRQTISDFECIVVDDCSPTPVAIPDDPRFKLVRNSRNVGASASRNRGLEMAQAPFVTVLDDDDLFAPERLALALPALEDGEISVCAQADLSTGRRAAFRNLQGDV